MGHKVWLPAAFWEYVAQWDGDNPSQQLHNALFDLERFRPDGPAAKKGREVDGRFTPHAPRLWEKGGDAP